LQDIDALDQWFDKARDCLRLEQYDEAILICKACIEEYSQWLYDAEEDASMFFHSEYQSVPFDIMEEATEHIDNEKLFNYCLSEMKKEKYTGTNFYDCFHNLLEILAVTVNPDAFIALQDELLADLKDKSSNEAETILDRKIDFYRRLGQEDKAWNLIKENIQIESFRREAVEKKIKEHNFTESEELINGIITEQEKDGNVYINDTWHKMLLEIAQMEKDIPAIKKLAYGFINNDFKREYYEIYKAAFSPAEWSGEMEKLFLLYSDKNYFNPSAADLLAAENESERLLQYTEKYLSIHDLERYYKFFAPAYPERTLELFKKVLVPYAENNIGRSYYEHIFLLLRKMSQIKGGKKVASDLAADFRMRYKNRRAMLEVLSNFTL
jgi:hypothetical protein